LDRRKPGAKLADADQPFDHQRHYRRQRGSPLIDKRAEIVGLIFDGYIFSLAGDYGFEAAKNRSVAVDSRALLEGLRKV
jgi:peptidase S46-like protein